MTNRLFEHERLFYREAQGCDSHACISGSSPPRSELFFTRHYADTGQFHRHLEPQAGGFCGQSPGGHANCLGWAPSCRAARAGSDDAEWGILYLHPLLFSALELLAHPNSVLVQPRILPPSELTIGVQRVERCLQRGSGSSVLPAGSTDTYRHPGRGTRRHKVGLALFAILLSIQLFRLKSPLND